MKATCFRISKIILHLEKMLAHGEWLKNIPLLHDKNIDTSVSMRDEENAENRFIIIISQQKNKPSSSRIM